MGVDISTYRCRVGRFVPHHGTVVICLPMNFSQLIKIIGAVSFVRILLVMAGIEQNPGPQDKYLFRYQYLLIEIGTKVLRAIFDVHVGHDFAAYLNSNSAASKTLTSLMTGKTRKITADQEKLLPPKEKKPKSSMYDITLLSCLLRNVCGLSPAGDQVWMNPLPTDHSIEADITRLRKCRNEMMHIDTLRVPEKDLKDKWQELVEILTRLNGAARIGHLSKLISDASFMDIDEELKQRYLETIKAWVTTKCSLDKVQQDVADLKRGHSDIQQDVAGLDTRVEHVEKSLKTQHHSIDHEDLRNHLMKIYKEECCTLSVSPLCDDDEDEVDILSIYKPPSLYHVPYHRTQKKEEKYLISSYMEIFYKDERFFRKIYITGDAGVGKTSFCKCMSFLWCKSQSGESVGDKSVQNDIDFMAKFDFVFYVSLRETRGKDVVNMIIEQLFGNENDLKKKERYESVENILKNKECIIILDALDEWTPTESGKININKIMSDKCIFITTCRPYKIENERLKPRDIDRQVLMTGINENSTGRYVTEVVNHVNKANMDNKKPYDFIREVRKCGLQEQLCIPIITSHLIAIWYDHKLTDMSRALIYSNIIDVLLKRAEKRKNIELPSSTESDIQFPGSLSELFYFKKHISFLKKICLLSFNLLFQQDKCLSELVFTTEQLESAPYCVSAIEMDFLCKFGILSKSKVIARHGKQEQKLSYLHKTYLEYFASLFVSSFDLNNAFDDVVKKWMSINDVVKYENFFLFFVGLSYYRTKIYIDNIYHNISDDLSLSRRNTIFHYNGYSYRNQMESLQTMVIKLFNEVSGSNMPNISFTLEDFIFYRYSSVKNVNSNVDTLKQIMFFNTASVKSIYSVDGKYYDEFDQIKNLQCLHVGEVLSGDCVKFIECIIQNQSTLHTVSIDGYSIFLSLLGSPMPELPVRSLQHLTSLCLSSVRMQYNSLHNLVNFLSDNVLIENIKLVLVSCGIHSWNDSDCALTLNLPHHTKLASLCLQQVNILCNNVNKLSLKSIKLNQLSERIVSCFIDVFNCIKDSQLERFEIDGLYSLDYNSKKTLTHTVKTLPYIKSLILWQIKLPDDVLLQLHPDVSQVKIVLWEVTLSRHCFHCFIESFVNNKSVIKVVLYKCSITSVDGETHRVLSGREALDYMSVYLTSIPTVNITDRNGAMLRFETRSCQ